ncbi:DUF2474 domain-containing protein [Pseudomonas reidholzensis]|nr:DUF2474 domain-containing protein [Pseudomonas reidholzensis]
MSLHASTGKAPGLGKRLLWLVTIWAASVMALGAVALATRVAMKFAGMTG